MAVAYGLSWKEIINTVTFGELLAKVIGTLDSLVKRSYTDHKRFCITFHPRDMSDALSASMSFNFATENVGFVKTDFQFKHLKVHILWLVKPNESRNKRRVKQLNTWKPASDDVQPHELKAGETPSMGATLLTAANKCWVTTPAEASGKKHCIKKCGLLCVRNQRKKKGLEKRRRSPREKNLCALLLLTFLTSYWITERILSKSLAPWLLKNHISN